MAATVREFDLKKTMLELVGGVLLVIIGAVLGGVVGTIGVFINTVIPENLKVNVTNGNTTQTIEPQTYDYLTPINSMLGSVFLILGVLLIVHAASRMIGSLLSVYETFSKMGGV